MWICGIDETSADQLYMPTVMPERSQIDCGFIQLVWRTFDYCAAMVILFLFENESITAFCS